MKRFLKRKSVAAFIIICLAGLFAPFIAGDCPSDVVGAPFARPVWWNGDLSTTREFAVAENGVSFEWDKLPPALFKLNGTISGKNVRIIFTTPDREYETAKFDSLKQKVENKNNKISTP